MNLTDEHRSSSAPVVPVARFSTPPSQSPSPERGQVRDRAQEGGSDSQGAVNTRGARTYENQSYAASKTQVWSSPFKDGLEVNETKRVLGVSNSPQPPHSHPPPTPTQSVGAPRALMEVSPGSSEFARPTISESYNPFSQVLAEELEFMRPILPEYEMSVSTGEEESLNFWLDTRSEFSPTPKSLTAVRQNQPVVSESGSVESESHEVNPELGHTQGGSEGRKEFVSIQSFAPPRIPTAGTQLIGSPSRLERQEDVEMGSADFVGAPRPTALPVFSAQAQITWKAMEIVEWNAQSCEVWQNHFVASCQREWVEPLWNLCNHVQRYSAEGHAQLQQSLQRQEEQWQFVRASLSERIQSLENSTRESCDNLSVEVQELLSMVSRDFPNVQSYTAEAHAKINELSVQHNRVLALVQSQHEEFSKANPSLVARAKALENFADESAQRTKELETWANQWSNLNKTLQDEVKQLAQRVLQSEQSVSAPPVPISVPAPIDANVLEQLLDLHRRVAEQEILLEEIRVFLQKDFMKPTRDSLLAEIAGLHERVELSEGKLSVRELEREQTMEVLFNLQEEVHALRKEADEKKIRFEVVESQVRQWREDEEFALIPPPLPRGHTLAPGPPHGLPELSRPPSPEIGFVRLHGKAQMKPECPLAPVPHFFAPAFEHEEPPLQVPQSKPLWSTPEMRKPPPPQSKPCLFRPPPGSEGQPPLSNDSAEMSQRYTGCADDFPPTPTLPGRPEISLTKPERFTEVRFNPETRAQVTLTPAPPLAMGGASYVKSPLQDVLSQQAKLTPYSGEKRDWPRFSKAWPAYLQKMGVDERTERDSVLVETLRMYIDPPTRIQWTVREEAGETLTYQKLWEELSVAFGMHSELYRKQEWQALRLRYEGSLNRTVWSTFLVRFENLAKELKVSESEKTQQFQSAVPAGLQMAISREKARVHRLTISGFPPHVPQATVQKFLEAQVGKPLKLQHSDDGDWLVFWEIQEEMFKTLYLNGKTVYLGEQPVTLSVTPRELTFEETKRVVIKELETTEVKEQMQIGREGHPQPRESRTQIRVVSPAKLAEKPPPPPADSWRPGNPCTQEDEDRCRKEGRCFRCGSKEHMYPECPERSSGKGKGKGRRLSDSRDSSSWRPPLSPRANGSGRGGAPSRGPSPSRSGTSMYLERQVQTPKNQPPWSETGTRAAQPQK